MNFVRNFVSSIPRVNLHVKNSLPVKTVEDKIVCFKASPVIIYENKNNNQKNNDTNNIDKLDNEYLTLKSIEHAFNN
jgi:hypothetical protein